ncbi:asparaginase [Streptomyces sp. NPDC000594]|uniref:asparaginase n=1 Tax=Streptomyces sp. NPDC000594 TaxID=3154261 RepID=UPI003330869A
MSSSVAVPRGAVGVLSLGGTIAMAHAPASGPDGVVPRLTGADLVAAVPDLVNGPELWFSDVRQVPGASLGIDDIAELAETLHACEAAGAAGFVVTQGTDTLEETAALLDLLYRGSAPLVLTGAMRNPTMAGADGPANLLAAVRTAADPAARDRGALVVFADQIHAARHVRKTHSTSPGAFASPAAGPVGHITEGRVRFHFSFTRTRNIRVPFVRRAEVEVIPVSLGSGGVFLDGLEERLDGAVVAAFGAGHVPAGWVTRLEEIAARIPLVLASRTGAGPVLSGTYGFAGSETDLLSRGLISAGDLDPLKARLLLLALLRSGTSRSAISDAFTTLP